MQTKFMFCSAIYIHSFLVIKGGRSAENHFNVGAYVTARKTEYCVV